MALKLEEWCVQLGLSREGGSAGIAWPADQAGCIVRFVPQART